MVSWQVYEQAEGYVAQSAGANALKRVYGKAWKTYNLEVEDFHTYVAGRVRVHNTSYDFVSKATGDLLYPQQVSRYNPDTGTFSQVVVFRPADGNTGTAVGNALKQVQSSDYSPSGSADSAFQITGSGPAVTLGSGTVADAGTVFSPGNGYTYVVNPNGSVTNIDTGQTTAPPSSSGTSSPATATSPALQPHTQVSGSGLRRCKSIPFAFPGSPPTGCAGLPSPLRGGVGGGGRAVAGGGPPPVPACGRSTSPQGEGVRLPAFLLAVPAPSAPVSSACPTPSSPPNHRRLLAANRSYLPLECVRVPTRDKDIPAFSTPCRLPPSAHRSEVANEQLVRGRPGGAVVASRQAESVSAWAG